MSLPRVDRQSCLIETMEIDKAEELEEEKRKNVEKIEIEAEEEL